MGYQIIKQPDNKFCVFSSIVDSIVVTDATPDEIIDWLADLERKQIAHDVNRIVGQLEKGEKPYYQFTMTYEEAVRKDRKQNG